jgi:hypothetical protein
MFAIGHLHGCSMIILPECLKSLAFGKFLRHGGLGGKLPITLAGNCSWSNTFGIADCSAGLFRFDSHVGPNAFFTRIVGPNPGVAPF